MRDECVITAQVRIHSLMTRRTRTSTQWPESWNSTSGAWKTRCSPRSDSWISYPPPVSLPSTGWFHFRTCSLIHLQCILENRLQSHRCELSWQYFIMLPVLSGRMAEVEIASRRWAFLSRLTHWVSLSPGACWNTCAHRSSTHSQSPVIHVATQWKAESEWIIT